MNNYLHEAVFFPDEGNLLLPNLDRVVLQNVKKRVILHHSHWKFQHLSVEERKNGATASSLGIQMRHVGNRHVIGEI